MPELPTRLQDLARSIVNFVRSAPPDVPDETLYRDVGRQISGYLDRAPDRTEGQFLRGYMKPVLRVLYTSRRPLYADEVQARVTELVGTSAGYVSINHCLRKGEARLLIDRKVSPSEGRGAAAVTNALTTAGRRYVDERLGKG